MPLNALPSEVLANGLPNDAIVTWVTGDGAVAFQPFQTFAACTVTLTRKPAGSASAVAGTSVTPDVTGYYQGTWSAGGFTENFTIFAFPAGVLGTKVTSDGKTINRACLAGAVRDPRCTLASFSAALEGGANNPNGIWTGTLPVQWAAYLA